MKYFGADRVVEPAGAIPSMAWKLDNSKAIGPAEARIALRASNSKETILIRYAAAASTMRLK